MSVRYKAKLTNQLTTNKTRDSNTTKQKKTRSNQTEENKSTQTKQKKIKHTHSKQIDKGGQQPLEVKQEKHANKHSKKDTETKAGKKYPRKKIKTKTPSKHSKQNKKKHAQLLLADGGHGSHLVVALGVTAVLRRSCLFSPLTCLISPGSLLWRTSAPARSARSALPRSQVHKLSRSRPQECSPAAPALVT